MHIHTRIFIHTETQKYIHNATHVYSCTQRRTSTYIMRMEHRMRRHIRRLIIISACSGGVGAGNFLVSAFEATGNTGCVRDAAGGARVL